MTLEPLLGSTALHQIDVAWNTSSELSGYGPVIAAGPPPGAPEEAPPGGEGWEFKVDRGTSLIRNSPAQGPYSRPMPRALWWS